MRYRMLAMAVAAAGVMAGASGAGAQNLQVSIGVRETGTTVPIGGNGGVNNGIEFINLDGLTLPLDGQWHRFTFNFGTDPVTAFAGATANGVLDGTRGTLEQVRLRNIDGTTQPLMVWIDDIVNTQATGLATQLTGFEGFALGGPEVMFQEPGFSGSTSANLVPLASGGPNLSSVVNDAAVEGTQSYRFDMRFVDADPTRWVRLTTNNVANLPNPAIDFAQGSTLSFSLRGVVVPEPAGVVGLAGAMALGVVRRRRG